jgi:beta-lactamase regulating signal transducer with metallopeptidase domain
MTEWLGDTLLATSALLLLVLLIRTTVARHFGAGTAYFLWALPAARLFMPTLTKEVRMPATTLDTATIDTSAVPAMIDMGAAIASGPAIDWTMVAASLWLGGALLLFIIQMYRYTAMREELLSDACEIDRIDGIRIVQTDRIPGPLAFGLLRRYVAVPREFTRTFSPRERELALAHELAHHRGGDLFANLAAFIVLCLMWFNPLAWLAWSAFRFDQEAACDARVVAGADASTRQSYGRALARTATEGLPAFAMALNDPKTIIQRLRRLMMNETSKGRRLSGRLAILAAAAVALPLTATVVPVFAEDEPAAADTAPDTEKKVELRKHKVIIVKKGEGEGAVVDVTGDGEAPFARRIEKDGKTIILRSNREISEADAAKMVADAEAGRAVAEAARGDAEMARADAEVHRKHVVRIVSDMDVASLVPEIDIRELRANCKEGEHVSTDVSGADGKKKSRVRIVMCGKGQAAVARSHAVQGLREARTEIEADAEISDSVRKKIIESLNKQIEKLEGELKNAPVASDGA